MAISIVESQSSISSIPLALTSTLLSIFTRGILLWRIFHLIIFVNSHLIFKQSFCTLENNWYYAHIPIRRWFDRFVLLKFYLRCLLSLVVLQFSFRPDEHSISVLTTTTDVPTKTEDHHQSTDWLPLPPCCRHHTTLVDCCCMSGLGEVNWTEWTVAGCLGMFVVSEWVSGVWIKYNKRVEWTKYRHVN